MNPLKPRVSLGLPIYNGERFLRQALDAILNQTYEAFELIICDNASTDQTETICRDYAANDSRIHYHRNAQNLGAGPNFNRVFELATGEYFKWVACDDVLTPDYLKNGVAILDREPSVLWCHSKTVLIDEAGLELTFYPDQNCFFDQQGNVIPNYDPPRRLHSWKPAERYRDTLIATRWCFEVFGLIRTDALRTILRPNLLSRTELMGPYYGSDKVLLSELSLMGRYTEISDALFLRRCHAKQSSAIGTTTKSREDWIKSKPHVSTTLPKLMVPPRLVCVGGYTRAIVRSQLSWVERIQCFGVLLRFLIQFERWQRWIREVFTERATVAERKALTNFQSEPPSSH
jgi:glycosyltransferase involved in cell wall biosynthesis